MQITAIEEGTLTLDVELWLAGKQEVLACVRRALRAERGERIPQASAAVQVSWVLYTVYLMSWLPLVAVSSGIRR